MRVRIGTIEIDDESRRLINVYYGRKGLASRKDVHAIAHMGFDQLLGDMCYEAREKLGENDDEV